MNKKSCPYAQCGAWGLECNFGKYCPMQQMGAYLPRCADESRIAEAYRLAYDDMRDAGMTDSSIGDFINFTHIGFSVPNFGLEDAINGELSEDDFAKLMA